MNDLEAAHIISATPRHRAPELGVRLPELAAQREGLRLPRVALGDRPLQIRLQRQAELLRGIQLFLDSRQPVRRLGEL